MTGGTSCKTGRRPTSSPTPPTPWGSPWTSRCWEAETGEATLTWDGPAPDLVQVVAWPASEKGDTEAHSTPLELLGDTLPLQAGEWIYRVKGSWSAQEEWGRHRGVRFYRQRAGGVPGAPRP